MDAAFPSEDVSVTLSDRETFHLHRVLRLRPGESCQIFNRKGWEALAVVEKISETEGAKIKIQKIFPLKQNLLLLKVAQALPQKRKMDDLVEKAEELGVHELWVLETERTIVKMRSEAREKARQRWGRIVIAAAKQSGSSVLTQIEGPLSFKKVLEEKVESPNTSFIFHPNPSGLSFSSMIEALRRPRPENPAQSIFLFFGPEGGFSEDEIQLAESRGIRKVYLGDSTLRLETAFIGAISAIRFLGGP